MNKKSIVVSYISENPSLVNEPVQLARKIVADTDGRFSLQELVKEIRETIPELLSEEGRKSHKPIISAKTIRTRVDNEFDGNPSEAARQMGLPERTVRRWYHQPQSKNKNINRFIITYAQNNTPLHAGFFSAIQHYLKENNAELIAYQGRYKNPNSLVASDDAVWDNRILPYLLNTERKLNEKLVIFPADTVPTATRPLSGFDVSTEDKSGIFPHPKYQLKTIATPSKSLPKILSTTGAITVPNYSDSKAGRKSKIHHVIGAVVVEIVDDKKFHLRQISADSDGSFYDISNGVCRKYSSDGVKLGGAIEGIVLGDIHSPFIDMSAFEASLKQISSLLPKEVFVHDLLDCWRVNHHSINDRFLNTAKQIHGLMNIEEEVNDSLNTLLKIAEISPRDSNVNVVSSNHDEALNRWISEADVDKLGVNSAFFHYLSYKKHLSAKKVDTGFKFEDAYHLIAKEKISNHFTEDIASMINFLDRDVPYMVKDIDCSMHGDVGASGSRGSTQGISKIGVKSIIAHGHSPEVIDGCYRVGVNSLIPLGYARGANNWLHTNALIYPNGKRTLINSIDGEYYYKKQEEEISNTND